MNINSRRDLTITADLATATLTLGDLRALVQEADRHGFPDSATVKQNRNWSPGWSGCWGLRIRGSR